MFSLRNSKNRFFQSRPRSYQEKFQEKFSGTDRSELLSQKLWGDSQSQLGSFLNDTQLEFN